MALGSAQIIGGFRMNKRLLAVDYGLARVGLAISDPLGITAQPLATIDRRGDKQVCREIADVVRTRDVGEVIVGLPLELSGNRGEAALAVDKFVARLENHVHVPVTTWDERLTTSQAERALAESGLNWKKRRKVVDQVAACLILQGVLEARSGGGSGNADL